MHFLASLRPTGRTPAIFRLLVTLSAVAPALRQFDVAQAVGPTASEAAVAPIEENATHDADSVLIGRWGDLRAPEQLLPVSKTKKCRALAVVAFSCRCPLARRLTPLLNEMVQAYDDAGVQFIALFPNTIDDLTAIAAYAVETDLAMPVYQDDRLRPWFQRLGLRVTPEVVLLDVRSGFNQAKVVYRGQINAMWAGGGRPGSHKNYLQDAIESHLADRDPPLATTAASGCPIAWQSTGDNDQRGDVTFHKDIVPLLQRRCESCHRAGQPGAETFSAFDSPETAAALSGVMLNRIENRLMPPWHAEIHAPQEVGGFQHDPRLSQEEIDLFRAWVARNCPIGDPADAPPPIEWPSNDAWQIGEPDLVFAMPEPFQVPRLRLDDYQFYRIKANFSEDRYIQAIEMRPGNRTVVHHMGAILGPASHDALSANQAMFALYGLTGEKVKKVGDYIPGDPFNARVYPEGYALKLPAGHDIFFEMHYTPTGRLESPDLSRMGIRWAAQKPQHVLQTHVFNRKDVRLRPHVAHYERTNYYQFRTDVLIYALAPHMHFRGKDFTLYKATHPQTPSEQREKILTIAAYDFNWQRTYEFEKPLRLRAGEVLYSVAHFDNSHFNPHNPDPEATVKYGLQSTDEMLNLRVKFEEVDLGPES